jgi:hypothetical protein
MWNPSFTMHAFYSLDSFSPLGYTYPYYPNVLWVFQSLDTGALGGSDQFVQTFWSQPHEHYARFHLHHTYILQYRLIFSADMHPLYSPNVLWATQSLDTGAPFARDGVISGSKISATLNYKIGPCQRWLTLCHPSAEMVTIQSSWFWMVIEAHEIVA